MYTFNMYVLTKKERKWQASWLAGWLMLANCQGEPSLQGCTTKQPALKNYTILLALIRIFNPTCIGGIFLSTAGMALASYTYLTQNHPLILIV